MSRNVGESSPITRLGWVLFWGFRAAAWLATAAAALLIGFLAYVQITEPQSKLGNILSPVAIAIGILGLAGLLYALGRACRYVLSNE